MGKTGAETNRRVEENKRRGGWEQDEAIVRARQKSREKSRCPSATRQQIAGETKPKRPNDGGSKPPHFRDGKVNARPAAENPNALAPATAKPQSDRNPTGTRRGPRARERARGPLAVKIWREKKSRAKSATETAGFCSARGQRRSASSGAGKARGRSAGRSPYRQIARKPLANPRIPFPGESQHEAHTNQSTCTRTALSRGSVEGRSRAQSRLLLRLR
jgi:hypothetical protein